MRASNLSARKLTCPVCATSVCFRCREEWHGYCTTCEQNLERKLDMWASNAHNISFCPLCRTRIEKNEGCNHMTCPFCSYEFCWICKGYAGGFLVNDHFNPISPLSCGVGKFEKDPGICMRFGKQLLFFIAAIILLPILLVLAMPCFCFASVCYKCGDNVRDSWCHFVWIFPLSISMFIVGLFLDIVVVPIVTVILLGAGIGYLIKACLEKRRHQRQAQAHIDDIINRNR